MKISAIVDIAFHELTSLGVVVVFFEHPIDCFLRKPISFHHRFPESIHLSLIGSKNDVLERVDKTAHLRTSGSFRQSIKPFATMSFDCFIDMPATIQMSTLTQPCLFIARNAFPNPL